MSENPTMKPATIKRVTSSDAAVAATTGGQPTLLVSTTSSYNSLYNDKGSGASMDVTIYRPVPADGYFIIGDYAQGNYSSPYGFSDTVQALNDDPAYPLLKAPTGYSQVWTDKGSGGDSDGSVWYPQPPPGYVSVGYVGQNGYNTPSIDSYRCLRKDLVTETSVTNLIWSDEGSGADQDVSLYAIQGATNAFVAQADYNPYTGTAYKLAE